MFLTWFNEAFIIKCRDAQANGTAEKRVQIFIRYRRDFDF